MYKLVIPPQAQKEIRRISPKHQRAIRLAVLELKEDPLLGKPLGRELSNKFSYRVGVYRIVYKINKKDEIITIITAGHRGKVYIRK